MANLTSKNIKYLTIVYDTTNELVVGVYQPTNNHSGDLLSWQLVPSPQVDRKYLGNIGKLCFANIIDHQTSILVETTLQLCGIFFGLTIGITGNFPSWPTTFLDTLVIAGPSRLTLLTVLGYDPLTRVSHQVCIAQSVYMLYNLLYVADRCSNTNV